MARRLDPTIQLQQLIASQLLGALQSDVLTEVRQALQGRSIEFSQRAEMAATGLKITPQTMPSLYNLFMEVKQELEYPEEVITEENEATLKKAIEEFKAQFS